MQKIRVVCEGISPLLLNPMTEETLEEIRTKNARPKQRDISREEEASAKLIHDEDGNLAIPVVYLFGALVEAGRKVKNGKTQVSTAGSTTLYSFMTIVGGEFMPLLDDPKWEPDLRRGTGQNNVAVAIVRPKFKVWKFEVIVEINLDTSTPRLVRDIFDIAGSTVGLGDFRPAKKGPFGRFGVTVWEELERSGAQVGGTELEEGELVGAGASSNGNG